MILKRWWQVFSLLLLCIPVKLGWACGWWPEAEQYRFSAFLPYVAPASALRPFFFNSQFLNDYENVTGQKNDRERNVEEWFIYLRKKVSSEDIYKLLYETDEASLLEMQQQQHTTAHAGTYQNTFYRYLNEPAHSNVLKYIRYAKRCENRCSAWNDPWEEEDFDGTGETILAEEGLAAMKNEADKFLRMRYAFQLIRLQSYSAALVVSEAKRIYKREIADKKVNTIIKPWAMFYLANSITGDSAKAETNYYYAKAFWQCDEKKKAAFNYFVMDELGNTLKLAKNKTDQTDILALAALERPTRKLTALKQIIALQPNHPSVQLIITREIEKCEDWLLTYRINKFEPAVDLHYDYNLAYNQQKPFKQTMASDKNYAFDLLGYLKGLAITNRRDKAFMNLAAAHVALIVEQYDTAAVYIQQAQKLQAKQSNGIQFQIQLTGLMIEAARASKVDSAFEAKVYQSVKWLNTHNNLPDAEPLTQQFMAFLSGNYLHQGQEAKAVLCRSMSRRYCNIPLVNHTNIYEEPGYWSWDHSLAYLAEYGKGNDVVELLALVKKRSKTPFENLLVTPFKAIPDMDTKLYDIAGTLFLRDDSLEESLHYFSKIRDSYWNSSDAGGSEYIDANSFYAHPGSNHRRCKADSVTYNKKTFVQKLIRLKRTAASTRDGKLYLAIAHAYYNMTNYGNSWNMVHNYQSSTHMPHYTYYRENFFGCKAAMAWYKKTLQHAKDRETEAACYAMLAQCEKNRTFMHAVDNDDDGYYSWGEEHEKKFAVNSYLQKFLQGYDNTDYYKNTIAECGGRKEFIYAFRNFAF